MERSGKQEKAPRWLSRLYGLAVAASMPAVALHGASRVELNWAHGDVPEVKQLRGGCCVSNSNIPDLLSSSLHGAH
jgi:hypothetical protein